MMEDDQKTAARRNTIIAAAMKVFNVSGYAEAKMDQVAAEAGLSKGSIYNYFESKYDLFTQMVVDVVAGHEADIEQLLAGCPTAEKKLLAYADYWLSQIDRYRTMGGVIVECWAMVVRRPADGRFAEAFRDIYARGGRRIAAILAEGQSTGEFRADVKPELTATMFMGMMDGILLQVIAGLPVNLDEGLREAIRGSLVAGVEITQPAAKRSRP